MKIEPADTPANCSMSTEIKQTGVKFANADKLMLTGGLLVLLIISTAIFWPTTTVGFLLDDFYHMDYLYRAFNGAPHLVLRQFYNNFSYNTDALTSYRPLLSVFYCLDYAISNSNAFGFHIDNILQFGGCCLLVALIGFELATCFQLTNKVFPSLAAGLLFAVYPLHVESVAWIAGRCDVQCALFYLSAFYAYLIYRRDGRASTLTISAIAFLCALTSKEMAVTLPAVLTIAQFLLPAKPHTVGIKRFLPNSLLLLWGLLVAFALFRTAVLGTLIGGYGSGDLKVLRHSLSNFVDTATLLKVLFGASDEVGLPQYFSLIAYLSLFAATVITLVRSIASHSLLRLNALLIAWTVLTVLPTFQIWHISPNLVGSRLFFLGSAPLCLLLAFGTLAANKQQFNNKLWLSLGASCLSSLVAVWWTALSCNLQPWLEAGTLMRSTIGQVQQIIHDSKNNETILFASLPQDHHGAPLLGRPDFLYTLAKPPFMESDQSQRLITAERPVAGGHDYIYPQLLRSLRQSTGQSYVWHAESKHFVAMEPHSTTAFTPTFFTAKDLLWQPYPGNKVSWLPLPILAGDNGLVLIVETDSTANDKALPQLIWRSSLSGAITNQIEPSARAGSMLIYAPARLKSWTLNGAIRQVGLRCYDGSPVTIKSVRLLDIRAVEPALQLKSGSLLAVSPQSQWLLVTAQMPLTLTCDAGQIAQANQVQVYVSKAGQCLPDAAACQPPDQKTVLWTGTINGTTGTITIPTDLIKDKAVHQVAAMAMTKLHSPIGLLSEPKSFRIR